MCHWVCKINTVSIQFIVNPKIFIPSQIIYNIEKFVIANILSKGRIFFYSNWYVIEEKGKYTKI